ncbi:Uncharacterised protein [uncultured archaeon]|nr:Uncharacterised protein [uncultured archaeon]
MEPKYLPADLLIRKIDEPNRSALMKLMSDNLQLFSAARGSSNNHQAWAGGYLDHVKETMNTAAVLYEQLNGIRPLPFSLSDALLVMFLHDVEKPWKYELKSDGALAIVESLTAKDAQHEFRRKKFDEYGITFTREQANALRYVEGEGKDYSPSRRAMGPLAAFCHICDMASARMWFDYPMENCDPWAGAERTLTDDKQ